MSRLTASLVLRSLCHHQFCQQSPKSYHPIMADDRKSMDEIALEKAPWAGAEHLRPHMRAGLTRDDAEFLYSWDADPKRQGQVFHKVDWRLCPMLAILYLISHLDR